MELLFYILLVVIAFLYASVGHGGASGYLALMAFFSFTPEIMRPVGLLLNIFVSLVAFLKFYRGGYFRWNLFWPFAVSSIPAAYLGGFILIDPGIYKKILGVLLIFSIIRLIGFDYKNNTSQKSLNLTGALLAGALIGLFSGMIGIGGGIILSPIILLLNWANMKQTAAVSALFIFVNSLAGLGGLLAHGFVYESRMTTMLIVAFIGGLAGAYFGVKKFDTLVLKSVLALVLVIASIKLLTT
jgi:uncharacterized membrane protein YfcA